MDNLNLWTGFYKNSVAIIQMEWATLIIYHNVTVLTQHFKRRQLSSNQYEVSLF